MIVAVGLREAVLEGFVPEVGKELETFEALIDVTDAVRAAGGGGDLVRVTLVVVDNEGGLLPHTTLQFDRALLVSRDIR